MLSSQFRRGAQAGARSIGRSATNAQRSFVTTLPKHAPPPAQSSPADTSTIISSTDIKGKGKDTTAASVDSHALPAEEDALPFLSRPLGVKERPSTVSRSWREDMMDQERRMDQRKALVKEATRGYFTDLNATRRHGGKTWVAPRVMIREDKALYFPDMVGTTLLAGGEKAHTTDLFTGKVSVVSMLSSKISEIQTGRFTEPTLAAYSSHPMFQQVSINLQENLLKSLLVSLFARSIRKSIKEEDWGRYLISSQSMDYVRDEMGITNRHVGYVYLVDGACRIRWAACADPKQEEIDALKACVGALLKRQK